MYKIILGLFCAFALTAQADTQVIFGRGDSKGTVLMMAMSVNPDAIAFFNSLAMDPLNEGGRWTKRFQFTDSDGARAMDVVCAFSNLAKETGSCTVTFRPTRDIKVSGAERVIRYVPTGEDVARVAALFKFNDSGSAFISSDNHFRISAVRDDKGGLKSLELVYGE